MTSGEAAVQLLVEKTHAAWKKQGSWVVSILSLDVEGAFDNVSHARLIHNLKKRRIPTIIVKWIESFLTNRATYITLEKERSDPFHRTTGIPQGSSLSPILYLFYNADLLDLCDDQELRTSRSGYLDDVNIFTFSTSTVSNCQSLTKIHDGCLQWADKHCSKFSVPNYELIHLTRMPCKHNIHFPLHLQNFTIQPRPAIRVLGIYMDSGLTWRTQLNEVVSKAKSRINILTSLTASTWGSSLAKAKTLYTAMIRPVMLFGGGVWLSPRGCQGFKAGQLPWYYTLS